MPYGFQYVQLDDGYDRGKNGEHYWIENWDFTNRSGQVWVNVTNIPAGVSTMRMWYGNPSASSSSNGDNAFIFFDDFPGTSINTGKWDVAASGFETCSGSYNDGLDIKEIDANGNLHIYDSGSYWCGLRSLNITFPENWKYSVKLKVDADIDFQVFGRRAGQISA